MLYSWFNEHCRLFLCIPVSPFYCNCVFVMKLVACPAPILTLVSFTAVLVAAALSSAQNSASARGPPAAGPPSSRSVGARHARVRGRAASAAILRGGRACGQASVRVRRPVHTAGEVTMMKENSKADLCRRAAASAASESYAGCGSSTPGLGGRAGLAPRYTFGLLQTSRSSVDSTGGLSSSGVRPGSSSGEGPTPSRAARSSRVKPPVPGRGGEVRRCQLCRGLYPLLLSCPLGLGRASKELPQAVLTVRRRLQHLFILVTSFFHSPRQNSGSCSSYFFKYIFAFFT